MFSLAASMLWGLVYVLDERVYKYISVTTSLTILSAFSFIVMISIALYKKTFLPDVRTIIESKNIFFIVLLLAIVFASAELCIGLSISNKNATLAGLIEISYPIFIALFAYFLFKENSINLATIAGASLIFSGIFIIYHFNH